MSPLTAWRRGSPVGRLTGSLGAELFALLLAALVLVFAILGYLNIRLHRRDLERATLHSAQQIGDTLQRSTSYAMLHNDREGLAFIVQEMKAQPGVEHIRILDNTRTVRISTAPHEVGTVLPMTGQPCYACHESMAQSPEQFRIGETPQGRVLGVTTPIFNSPTCSTAECHAHPAEQKLLGLLDTSLSLRRADEALAAGTRQMLVYSVLATLAVAVLSGLFVWTVVQRRMRSLMDATERLAAGELGYQIPVRRADELAELARAFNRMSSELREARDETQAWARTLEERVDQKTTELRLAHEQMLQTEKLASLGRMAAVVAHEVNNPLSGILTYAKLLRRWVTTDQAVEKKSDMEQSLALIESESRRCGEIVRNLLSFSRNRPLHLASVHVEAALEQCTRLLEHKMKLNNIALERKYEPGLPPVRGDAAQLEQLFLALIINAIEAMPHEGTLRLEALRVDEGVRVAIEDDGVGIPEDVLARLFEPFVTTKEGSGGVGLGLAISQSIVERHRGKIEVRSRVGQGTRFTITLPVYDAQTLRGEPCPEESFSSSTMS